MFDISLERLEFLFAFLLLCEEVKCTMTFRGHVFKLKLLSPAEVGAGGCSVC